MARKVSAKALILLAVAGGMWAADCRAGSSVPLPPRKQQQIQVSTKAAPLPGNKPVSEITGFYETRNTMEDRLIMDAAIASRNSGGHSAIGNVRPSPSADEDLTSRLLSFDSFRTLLGINLDNSDEGEDPADQTSEAVDFEPEATPEAAITVIPSKKPETFSKIFVYTSFEKQKAPAPHAKPVPAPDKKMSEDDANIYKEIFAAQAKGDIERADELLLTLKDFRLLGHVLQQRYLHPTAYVSSFEELANWLELYADYPGASKVYRLAAAKNSKREALRKPVSVKGIHGYLESADDRSKAYVSPRDRSASTRKEVGRIVRSIRREVDLGSPAKALKLLEDKNTKALLDETEQDILKGYIAYGELHSGNYEKAFTHAHAAVSRSGNKVPLAGWVAGLVNWRKGKYELAAKYFEVAASSPYASGWTISASAYWASRSHMRTGNYRAVSYWLQKSSEWPRTFYGLIATRALGRNYAFNWDIPVYTDRHRKIIVSNPAARRTLLLLQADQTRLAEAELRQIDASENDEIGTALLAYASHESLPSLAMKLANAIPHPKGGFYDAALYPIVPWQPKEGYKVDLALIHAIMRQESRFDPAAENRSGATGLMQLMPATASYVDGNQNYKGSDGRFHLKDPLVNIELGQSYVEDLLGHNNIDRDLFALAIAYNAGPGKLARWKDKLRNIEDPLLFVESIPVAQTRAYVERVLANYWIYRMRLGQPTPTLDAVASGKWARYVSMDDSTYYLADIR